MNKERAESINIDESYGNGSSVRIIIVTIALSFFAPVVIMAIALLRVQIWPGGKFTLLTYDLLGQFSPVISSLRYLGNSDHSIFYSFFGALGNNALLNYMSYIVDPTIWITVMFPLEQLPNIIYFITLFKIGLCGVGICLFLFFGKKGKKYPVIIFALSTCYALMSYNIMYSQCILWFNVIALAPLILLGLERIIEEKGGAIYVTCMTLALYYNYQLAYMVGIFVVLYLIYRLSEINENRIRIMCKVVICNLFCVGLFMPFFMPALFNIFGGRLKAENLITGSMFYYQFGDVVKQFLSCRYSTIESGGLPNVFCGTFIPLIAISGIGLPIKPLRTRMILGFIILFFISSFCIVPINQFWHGFNEPNSYPARYSFLLSLFLIISAYDSLCFLCEKINISRLAACFMYVVIIVMTCVELFLNAGYILSSINIEKGYGINEMYQRQLYYVKDALNSISDDGFYRIGRDLTYGFNEGMRFGYNGIGYFSSMFERNTMDFIGELGYSENEHVLTESGGTSLVESMLGVKYKILKMPELFGYYDTIHSNKIYEVQRNESALPVGIIMKNNNISADKELISEIKNHNSFAFQEFIFSELAGRRVNAYNKIEYELEEVDSIDYARHVKMRFIAVSEAPVWIYCKDDHDGRKLSAIPAWNSSNRNEEEEQSLDSRDIRATLSVNGEKKYPFVDSISTMCIYLGTFKVGDEIEVEAECSNYFDDPWIVYYNVNECEEELARLKDTGLKNIEHKNGVIKGRIKVEDNELLIMTLPYMKGYNVRVDGVKTAYSSYRDALLALKMKPGYHEVEISFIPYGFVPGVVIGCVSLALCVLILLFENRNGRVRVGLKKEK